MSKSRLLQPVVRRYLVTDEGGTRGRMVSTEGPITLKDVVTMAIGSYELKDAKAVTVFELKDGIDFKISTTIERVELPK